MKVVGLSALRTSRPQGHSAAGRIMPKKNFSDTVGSRTRDLPLAPIYAWYWSIIRIILWRKICKARDKRFPDIIARRLLRLRKAEMAKGKGGYVTRKRSLCTQHLSLKGYMFRLYETAIIRLHVSEIWPYSRNTQPFKLGLSLIFNSTNECT